MQPDGGLMLREGWSIISRSLDFKQHAAVQLRYSAARNTIYLKKLTDAAVEQAAAEVRCLICIL